MQNMNLLQIRPEITRNLNLQYRTHQFSQHHTFHELLHICTQAIKDAIFSVKYNLNSYIIQHYKIKDDTDRNKCPFQPHEEHFLHQLVSACQLAISEPEYRNLNTLNQFILEQRVGPLALSQEFKQMGIHFRFLSIKQAMIYLALSQCKIWYIVCRNRKKNKKQFELDPLINLFITIVAKIKLQNPFHKTILTKKAVKHIQKKEHIQKSNNPLFDAVSNSDYGLVKELILKGAKIQKPSFYNRSHQIQMRCTHRACMNNDLEMCKILNSFGADWEAEDSEKMSPIFYAVQGGSLQVIKFLVQELKVDIEKKEIQNRTPFYFACTQNSIQVIDYLHKAGCNINMKSQLGRTALSKACYLGRVDIVTFLLSCKEIDMYSRCKKGRTALHNAIFGPKGGREGQKFGTNEKDSPQCAQILLESGIEVDTLDYEDCTPLHVAMSSEALDSIRILLAFGASLTARNNYGETPLMTAAKFGHVDAVKIVVEQYHDDILIRDIFNKNLLLLTAKFKQNGEYGINPAYYYLLQPFVEKCLQNKKIDELHYTFTELLINESPIQLQALWKSFIKFDVPLPTLKIAEIQKLLNLSINRRTIIESNLKYLNKAQQKQAFKLQAAKQSNIAADILKCVNIKEESLSEIGEWLIKNNDGKLLDFILEAKLIDISRIQLPTEKIFNMIENDGLALKERVVSFCLISMNCDWPKFRNKFHENIIHILIRKQKTGSLIQIFKALSSKIPQHICINKYLNNLNSPDQKTKVLYELLREKNQSDLTPHQLSLILKNRSVAKIIEEKMKEENFQVHEMLDIHEYEGIVEKEEQELYVFHEKNHQKEDVLEELEFLIEEMGEEEIENTWRVPFVGLQNRDQEQLQKFIDERTLIYIQEQASLQAVQHLLKQTIIGIDLEYFNQDGITIISTLQLSSITTDLIIDCLKIPLKKIRKALEGLFHNEKILKVMHGADNDIVLLRSSFNLCLINFLDTSRIDIEIRKTKNDLRGLSTLCKQYMGIVLSKEYQVSEWRIRPIPKPMLQYARKDSMILPYLLSQMLTKIESTLILKQLILNGCRQVRRNKKQSQPLLAAIKCK